jgi:hypothetical protein
VRLASNNRRPSLVSEPNNLDPFASTARIFRSRPSGVFVEEFIAHVKQTGQPETFEGLYHGRLPSNTKYRILRKFDIDGKKRQSADMAPCPMCTPNRFLHGALVWLYELQMAAAIGHCCAEHANEAEKAFKHEEERRRQEDYLLVALPWLDRKKAVIEQLQPAAKEALRVHRKLRKGCGRLLQHLRHLIKLSGGRLYVIENLRSSEDEASGDYFGPAGFRGRGSGQIETRDHDLGHLNGTTALLSAYNPTKELAHVKRQVESFDFTGNEEEALNFIVSMTPEQKRAAVAIFQEIDRHYLKFIARLVDFSNFFERGNIEALHRYGTHPLNTFKFRATYDSWKGLPQVRFSTGGSETSIVIGLDVDNLNFRWEAPLFEKS